MPDRITLYVSDEAKPLIEEFKEFLGETSLSSVFADCLRSRVDAARRSRKVAAKQKSEVQEVELEGPEGWITSKKVFSGTFIGSYEAAVDFDGTEGPTWWEVYLSAKGAVVGVIQGYGEDGFRVYKTVEQFLQDQFAPVEAKKQLAVITEEPFTEYLDI